MEVRKDDGSGQLWTYGYFKVDGPEINYILNIGQAQGPSDGYNSMANHNGMQFQLVIGTMMPLTTDTMQRSSMVKDGGLTIAIMHSSLIATVIQGYTGIIREVMHTIILLR